MVSAIEMVGGTGHCAKLNAVQKRASADMNQSSYALHLTTTKAFSRAEQTDPGKCREDILSLRSFKLGKDDQVNTAVKYSVTSMERIPEDPICVSVYMQTHTYVSYFRKHLTYKHILGLLEFFPCLSHCT